MLPTILNRLLILTRVKGWTYVGMIYISKMFGYLPNQVYCEELFEHISTCYTGCVYFTLMSNPFDLTWLAWVVASYTDITLIFWQIRDCVIEMKSTWGVELYGKLTTKFSLMFRWLNNISNYGLDQHRQVYVFRSKRTSNVFFIMQEIIKKLNKK